MNDRIRQLADELARIEEELRDLAFDRLADRARDPDGADSGAVKEQERRLEQARRGVARATAALRALTDGAAGAGSAGPEPWDGP